MTEKTKTLKFHFEACLPKKIHHSTSFLYKKIDLIM